MADIPAELMTGIPENPHGIGQFYDEDGNEINREEAQDQFLDGKGIAVPNAGAGSYEEVFNALGFEEVKTIEDTSSAGEWTFAIRDQEDWYIAYQSNRSPRCGFVYTKHDLPFDSFEDACDFACNAG